MRSSFKFLIFTLICGVLVGMSGGSTAMAADENEVGCVTTEWKILGSNHKVCVQAFTDPDLPGVTCYVSQARTGGVKGSLGLAEDPSNFSIDCIQTGPIEIPAKMPREAKVFRESTSLFFKATRVTRFWDKARNTLVYLAISRHLSDGSPSNSISTVPIR